MFTNENSPSNWIESEAKENQEDESHVSPKLATQVAYIVCDGKLDLDVASSRPAFFPF